MFFILNFTHDLLVIFCEAPLNYQYYQFNLVKSRVNIFNNFAVKNVFSPHFRCGSIFVYFYVVQGQKNIYTKDLSGQFVARSVLISLIDFCQKIFYKKYHTYIFTPFLKKLRTKNELHLRPF